MQYITEQEIDRITTATCQALAAEPRVKLHIESVHGEEYWEGGINGHFFRVRTGETVEVPASLARIIEQSAKARRMAEETVRSFAGGRGRKLG